MIALENCLFIHLKNVRLDNHSCILLNVYESLNIIKGEFDNILIQVNIPLNSSYAEKFSGILSLRVLNHTLKKNYLNFIDAECLSEKRLEGKNKKRINRNIVLIPSWILHFCASHNNFFNSDACLVFNINNVKEHAISTHVTSLLGPIALFPQSHSYYTEPWIIPHILSFNALDNYFNIESLLWLHNSLVCLEIEGYILIFFMNILNRSDSAVSESDRHTPDFSKRFLSSQKAFEKYSIQLKDIINLNIILSDITILLSPSSNFLYHPMFINDLFNRAITQFSHIQILREKLIYSLLEYSSHQWCYFPKILLQNIKKAEEYDLFLDWDTYTTLHGFNSTLYFEIHPYPVDIHFSHPLLFQKRTSINIMNTAQFHCSLSKNAAAKLSGIENLSAYKPVSFVGKQFFNYCKNRLRSNIILFTEKLLNGIGHSPDKCIFLVHLQNLHTLCVNEYNDIISIIDIFCKEIYHYLNIITFEKLRCQYICVFLTTDASDFENQNIFQFDSSYFKKLTDFSITLSDSKKISDDMFMFDYNQKALECRIAHLYDIEQKDITYHKILLLNQLPFNLPYFPDLTDLFSTSFTFNSIRAQIQLLSSYKFYSLWIEAFRKKWSIHLILDLLRFLVTLYTALSEHSLLYKRTDSNHQLKVSNSLCLDDGQSQIFKNILYCVQGVLKHKDLFVKYNLVYKPRIILSGPSGSGKSLIINKLIEVCNDIPIIIVNISTLYSPYVGETEENIKKKFTKVMSQAPAILVLEGLEYLTNRLDIDPNQNVPVDKDKLNISNFDIESYFVKSSVASYKKSLLTTLLLCLDGFDTENSFASKPIGVIGLSKLHPSELDPALVRPGRLEKWFILDSR